MTDPAPTPAAADPASGEQPGSETPASTSGSQPTEDTFSAERAQLDQRVRQEQSRADRAEARLRELEQAAATTVPGGAPTPDAPAGLTLEQMRAEMHRHSEITSVLPTLREQFTYADPAILGRAMEYDSAEALRAAVENSHKSVEALIAPAVAAEVAKLKERYAARFGPLTEDIAPPGGEPTSVVPGMPTLEELNRMPFPEYRKFANDNPEYVANLLRTA